MLDTKKILNVATQRYQDIITAVNKGDLEEIKGLCLSSIFSSEDEFYNPLVNDVYSQVLAIKSFYKYKCREYEWFKPFLTGFKEYLDAGETITDTSYWTEHKGIMYRVYFKLRSMLYAWYTEEPTCMYTDLSFQMYKLLESIELPIIWHKFIAPLTEYMEINACTIAASTKQEMLQYFINTLCEDL